MSDFPGEDGPIRLRFLRDELISVALLAAAEAVGATMIVIFVFDWDLKETLFGAIGGAVVVGAINYPIRVAKRLPSGNVPAPPDGAFIERATVADELRRYLLWALPLLALLFGVAWFVDRFDDGGFILPGVIIGDMLASLVAAAVAWHWEARHGKRLLIGEDDEGEEVLYAESPRERPDLLNVGGVPAQGPIHPR